MKHLKYMSYVIRHKWHVIRECWMLGLYWRGIVHDLSKFLPSEWFPYANYFYGKKVVDQKSEIGYCKPTNTGAAEFDFAWLLHQKRNRHHWQWWILPKDDGGVKVLPMPKYEILEMICDWRGAAMAQGKTRDSTIKWFKANRPKMTLHPETDKILNEILKEK